MSKSGRAVGCLWAERRIYRFISGEVDTGLMLITMLQSNKIHHVALLIQEARMAVGIIRNMLLNSSPLVECFVHAGDRKRIER
jgi:hypothetical protein